MVVAVAATGAGKTESSGLVEAGEAASSGAEALRARSSPLLRARKGSVEGAAAGEAVATSVATIGSRFTRRTKMASAFVLSGAAVGSVAGATTSEALIGAAAATTGSSSGVDARGRARTPSTTLRWCRTPTTGSRACAAAGECGASAAEMRAAAGLAPGGVTAVARGAATTRASKRSARGAP